MSMLVCSMCILLCVYGRTGPCYRQSFQSWSALRAVTELFTYACTCVAERIQQLIHYMSMTKGSTQNQAPPWTATQEKTSMLNKSHASNPSAYYTPVARIGSHVKYSNPPYPGMDVDR